LPKKIRSSCEAPSLRSLDGMIWQTTFSVAGWISFGELSWRGLWQRAALPKFSISPQAAGIWHWL
jgi:hypothetical protein